MHTILYIDDIHYTRMIDRFLSSQGYAVETAQDGHEGVRKARELQPDLIPLDLYLPRVRGIEVIAQLRQEALTWNIPIVVMSTLPIPQSRELMDSTGVQDYVSKPFKIQDLINTVRRNVVHRAGLSSDTFMH
jgi:CheY-like chemotaxis protein